MSEQWRIESRREGKDLRGPDGQVGSLYSAPRFLNELQQALADERAARERAEDALETSREERRDEHASLLEYIEAFKLEAADNITLKNNLDGANTRIRELEGQLQKIANGYRGSDFSKYSREDMQELAAAILNRSSAEGTEAQG